MSIFNVVESSYYIKFFSLRDERDVNPFARDRTQDLLIARRPLPHYTTVAGITLMSECKYQDDGSCDDENNNADC